MMASTILGLATLALFQGGDGNDLAKALAEATRAPVIVECGTNQTFEGFEFNPQNDNEMAKVIQKVARLRRAPGIDHAYHWPGLPSWLFGNPAVARLVEDTVRPIPGGESHASALANGIVNLRTEKRSMLPVSALELWKWAKPLRVHPIYRAIGVAANVRDLPERDFLNLVAKTIGARIVTTKDGLALEPNGAECQRRALATLAQAMAHRDYATVPALQRANLELSRAGIGSVSPAQIEGIVKGDGEPVRFPMSPAMRGPTLQLLKALSEPREDPSGRAQQTFGPPDPLRASAASERDMNRFRNLDPRLVGYATLGPGFEVRLELATVDSLGRPGAPIRVP